MAGYLRMLLGLALLPACWAFTRVMIRAIVIAAEGNNAYSPEAFSLLGGMAAFSLCWMALSHPIRTYVLGHELTHALWGLMFGARPSDVKVSAAGGSVKLTKSNFLITLAPYFFPFYTFVVVLVAIVTYAFYGSLPFLPLWMFLVGFTWAFHVLFTLQTLTRRQPDVKLYGRIFSWVFIFLANVTLLLVFLAAVTPLTFVELGSLIVGRVLTTYSGIFNAAVSLFN